MGVNYSTLVEDSSGYKFNANTKHIIHTQIQEALANGSNVIRIGYISAMSEPYIHADLLRMEFHKYNFHRVKIGARGKNIKVKIIVRDE